MKNYKRYGFNKVSTGGKLKDEIYFFEKIDGSQLSFLLEDNQVVILNKGNIQKSDSRLYADAYIYFDNIFKPEILRKYGNNYIFHGESMILKYRSSTLKYEKIPQGSFVCFGLQDKDSGLWLHPLKAQEIVKELGMTFAPLLWSSKDPKNTEHLNFELTTDGKYPDDAHTLAKMLTSGQEGKLKSAWGKEAEGIVVQSYSEGKIKFKKYVTPKFQEIQKQKKNKIADQIDIDTLLQYIGLAFCTPARYHKGYQKYMVVYNCPETLDKSKLQEYIWSDICEEQRDFMQKVLTDNIMRIYIKPWLENFYKDKKTESCGCPQIDKIINSFILSPAPDISIEDYITLYGQKFQPQMSVQFFLVFEAQIRQWALSNFESWFSTLALVPTNSSF